MLNETDLRDYCLSKKGTAEDFPFGDDVRVFKVMGKMFALIPVGAKPASISLKCDPNLAIMLRQTYPAVTPGYHLNKEHWNSIASDGSVPDDEIREMIDHSYTLVVKSLTRAKRQTLEKS